MADKELRKLNRRELLQMLLVQCEESERLEQELDEINGRFAVMSESYERLKKKLDIKDERLNEKDARISELGGEVEALKAELEKAKRAGAAGSAIAVTERIGEIFREAQRTAEEYLKNIQMPETESVERIQRTAGADVSEEKKQFPTDSGRIASIRKKQKVVRKAQTVFADPQRAGREAKQTETEFVSLDIAAGDFYG